MPKKKTKKAANKGTCDACFLLTLLGVYFVLVGGFWLATDLQLIPATTSFWPAVVFAFGIILLIGGAVRR